MLPLSGVLLERRARINNLTARNLFQLHGTNAHTALTGEEGDISNLCKHGQRYVIFPQRMKLFDGETTCKIHGGDLAVPKSDQESEQLLNIVSKHKFVFVADTDYEVSYLNNSDLSS